MQAQKNEIHQQTHIIRHSLTDRLKKTEMLTLTRSTIKMDTKICRTLHKVKIEETISRVLMQNRTLYIAMKIQHRSQNFTTNDKTWVTEVTNLDLTFLLHYL